METIKVNEIKPFDIMLEGSSSWLSKQIQHVINEKISHSGIFFKVDGILYIHESDRYGLRNTDFISYYLDNPKYKIFIARPRLEIAKNLNVRLRHEAVRTAGHKPYDFINLIFHQPTKWIMKKLFNKNVWWGKRKTDANKRFICSERTAYIMNEYFGIEPNWYKTSTEHFLHSKNYEIYLLEK
jgi:hypothetical protein